MLPAHNFYDLFRVKTVSHSPQRVGGDEQLERWKREVESRGVLSATCWREVELLISIFYYLKSVWRAEPEPPFCGHVIFLQQQRFKCSNENVFGFISYSKLALCMCVSVRESVSVCVSAAVFVLRPVGYIYWLGDKFLLPSFSFGLRCCIWRWFLASATSSLFLPLSLSVSLSCLSLCHFLCSPFFGRQSFRRVYRRQTDRLRV